MVFSCSGVPCCVIVGWSNGNQLMVDLVAHYLQGFVSIVFAGGILIEDCLAGFATQSGELSWFRFIKGLYRQ
jgi:hypothetical protein